MKLYIITVRAIRAEYKQSSKKEKIIPFELLLRALRKEFNWSSWQVQKSSWLYNVYLWRLADFDIYYLLYTNLKKSEIYDIIGIFRTEIMWVRLPGRNFCNDGANGSTTILAPLLMLFFEVDRNLDLDLCLFSIDLAYCSFAFLIK